MNYTEKQLKAALAVMLPEEIYTNSVGELYKHKQLDLDGCNKKVIDTELLEYCWLLEELLAPAVRMQFAECLYDLINASNDLLDYSACYYEGDSPKIDTDILFSIIHATWEFKVIALCKVKDIKIL